jgi:6-phosphogluconolactonase
MKVRAQVVPLAVTAVAALLISTGCSTSSCPSQGVGSNGGSSGTGSGATITSTCGPSGGGTPGTSALLYYIDASGSVQGASLSTAGTLAAFSGYTPPAVTVGADTRDMVIADKQFLYFPQGIPSVVQGYSINHSTGALTAIPGSPFATSGGDTIIADHLGRFIFISNSASGEVSAFQIDATTGALTQSPGSPFAAPIASGFNLAVDGTSKYLYVSQGNASLPTAGFSFDQSSGALTPIPGSPFSIPVAGLRAESTGLYLVGATGLQTDFNLYVFSIESGTGVPLPVSNSPFPTTYAPFNIAVSPVAAFVYNFGTDSSGNLQVPEGFSLDLSTGALSELSDSPFTSLPAVPVCRFEQTGSEMFCPGAGGTTFSVFGADSTTGALTFTIPNLTVTNDYPFAVTD